MAEEEKTQTEQEKMYSEKMKEKFLHVINLEFNGGAVGFGQTGAIINIWFASGTMVTINLEKNIGMQRALEAWGVEETKK